MEKERLGKELGKNTKKILNQKKAVATILVSHESDFETNSIMRDNEGPGLVVKGRIF